MGKRGNRKKSKKVLKDLKIIAPQASSLRPQQTQHSKPTIGKSHRANKDRLSIWKERFLGALGALSLTLTFLGGYSYYDSPISIEADTPIDSPSSLINGVFRITNEGQLPIENVQKTFYVYSLTDPVNKIEMDSWDNSDGYEVGMFLKDTIPPIAELFPHAKSDIPIPDVFHAASGKAGTDYIDMSIVVTYQTWLLNFPKKKGFRFIATKDTTGNLHWYPIAYTTHK